MATRLSRKLFRAATIAAFVSPALAAPAFAQADEEIVVTAQRRAESAQDVPISVTALGAQTIQDLGIKSSEDIAAAVPNLEIGLPAGRGNQPLISIRGVGLNDFNTNNAGPNGVYLDEVYISSPSAQTFAVFDLERIEVLKGPQGTLYGRNTTGGAINYIAARPTEDLSFSLRQSIASYSTYQTEGAVSGPLSDHARGRFAFVTNSSDGFMRNLVNGDRVSGANDFAVRALLDLDVTDKLSVQVNLHGGQVDTLPAEYRHVGTLDGPFGAVCSQALIQANQCVDTYGFGDAADFYEGSYNRTQHLSVENVGGAVRFDYDVGAMTLTSISAYDSNDKLHPEDSDANPFQILEIDYGVESQTFSQELRLAGESGAMTWLGGLYYMKEDLDQDQYVYVLLDLDSVFGPGAGDGGAQIGRVINAQESQSIALFGQATWDVAANTRLTVGGRYTQEERDFTADGTLAMQGVGAPSGVMGPATPIYSFDRSASDDAFSWRVALDYRPIESTLLYASIATGFKSGAFNGGFLSTNASEAAAQVAPVDPETVTAYEIGFKSDLLDGQLRVNGAAFYYDYSDLQVFNLIPAVAGGTGFPVQVLDNAESATIQGAEFEILWRPVDRLSLSANIGLLDTEVGTFVTAAGENFTGNQLALSPELKFTGIASYRMPVSTYGELSLQAMTSYRSDQFFDIRNDPLLEQEGYWLLDARVGFESADGHWQVAAFGRNLTDEEYLNFAVNLTSVFGLLQQNVGAPMTGGVEIAFHY